jgi:4-hydroxythreonine-4-phosphate dehydrogenase
LTRKGADHDETHDRTRHGDPAGISPELTTRLLALDDVVARARLVVIGDRRVLDEGAKVAAVRLDLKNVSPDADFSKQPSGAVFIDLGHLDPSSIRAKHR